MDFNEVLKLRQTTRSYKSLQIDKKQLKEILFAGMSAPISRKKYSDIIFTVVQNQELLRKISDSYHASANPLYGVPTLIIVSAKPSAIKNVEYFNVACIIENMLLSAANLGLGSIYLTSFLTDVCDNPNLLCELGIPKEYIPLSAIGIGYAKKKILPIKPQEIENRMNIIFR